MWGGPDLEGAERASNAKRRLRMWGQCDIRSEVGLFELAFAIASTAWRNLAVYSSLTAKGEGSASKSSGKHEPTIDAAFARYVGPASSKPIPILSR